MDKQNNQIEYGKERQNYIPGDSEKKDPIFKKLNQAKAILFYVPLVHLGTCVLFLILLLVGLLVKDKLGFTLTATQSALAFSYIGAVVLIDVLVFILPAKKAKKKNQFRVMAITTLIFSTFMLSGSFAFVAIPTLLFFTIVTLIAWILEIIAAIFLILVVEALPN